VSKDSTPIVSISSHYISMCCKTDNDGIESMLVINQHDENILPLS
jgi:hypothetical protein